MSRPNALGLAGWHDINERLGARADEIAPGLGTLINYELAYLDRAWPRLAIALVRRLEAEA